VTVGMDTQTTMDQKAERILQAVALERPDRVPVVLEYASFAAQATETPLPEFLLNMERSAEVMIEAWDLLNEDHEADAINYGSYSPYTLSTLWMSKVAVPGVDLPADSSHQVVEEELMTREDYDTILESGWPEFKQRFLDERVFAAVPSEHLPWNQPAFDLRAMWAKRGVPVLNGALVVPPFEYLCGGRTLFGFFTDLVEIPEIVIKVMDEMVRHEAGLSCPAAVASGYPVGWVGGWRTAPSMLSPEMWDRFVWPYMRRLIQETIDCGLIPSLHLDSSWDREIGRFRELPAGKMIVALDGFTDIHRASEILKGHSCIMGDVPATMLCSATADEVYEYSSRLVREIGPAGFILHSGCDIPENAKVENVQAMIAAVH
jgi:uroporphyrinogen decarboxylase-like protein